MDTVETAGRVSGGAPGRSADSSRMRAGEPALRGVHHLALVTDDMKGTCDFYVRVLGMPLVHALTTGGPDPAAPGALKHTDVKGIPPFPNIPHVFFDMGGDSLLAFFEYPKGKMPKSDRDGIAGMQHVSFVCGPQRYKEIEAHVRAAGVAIMGPILTIPPAIHSFYFFDPIGIRLEIVSDLSGDETAFRLIDSVRQTDDELRCELATFCDDPKWIEEMITLKRR